MKLKVTLSVLAACALLAACDESNVAAPRRADTSGANSAPTKETLATNARFAKSLDLAAQKDFVDAERGFIATQDPLVINGDDGTLVWSQKSFEFIGEVAPTSANPSLWRQERLNNIHGLFKVTDGVYQVRGFDVSNMTIIEGQTGRILIDPLSTTETASAAMALVNRELGQRPIKAVIYTHSHMDHFGGVMGIVDEADVASGAVRIIAPEGFMEEVVSENIIAGPTMARRARYMFGHSIAAGDTGHIGTGLGKGFPLTGTFTVIPPTDIITTTGQEMTIDGVRMVFQNTPHAEAPAELMLYLPDFKTFCGAEIVSRNMHNIYTLRGAKVRDALKWSGYIDEAIQMFGDDMQVIANSHHWPVFGRDTSVAWLKRQRDTYKFIHDQTVRMASSGMTPREISETITLPDSLASDFSTRGYYGTAKHNSKAVYQFYFGWFDGNPANLDPLPPVDEGSKYVQALGGAQQVMALGEAAYADGDYRWAATLVNNLVFADPANDEARQLLAASYDQMAYRAESGPWRDIYLTGASELRSGVKKVEVNAKTMEIFQIIPLEQFFRSLATRIDGDKADGKALTINFVFTDLEETWVINIENSVMHHWQREADPKADATVYLTRSFWLKFLAGKTSARDLAFSDELKIEGSKLKVVSFLSLLDKLDRAFAIVTP